MATTIGFARIDENSNASTALPEIKLARKPPPKSTYTLRRTAPSLPA